MQNASIIRKNEEKKVGDVPTFSIFMLTGEPHHANRPNTMSTRGFAALPWWSAPLVFPTPYILFGRPTHEFLSCACDGCCSRGLVHTAVGIVSDRRLIDCCNTVFTRRPYCCSKKKCQFTDGLASRTVELTRGHELTTVRYEGSDRIQHVAMSLALGGFLSARRKNVVPEASQRLVRTGIRPRSLVYERFRGDG